MVRPTYKDYWDIPGGYVEPGESPYAACLREVREELSLDVPVAAQPLVIDWAPAEGEGDKILFIFDGGTLTDDELSRIRFADGELAELRYIGSDEAGQYTISRLARRLQLALSAKSAGRPIYGEHGRIASGGPPGRTTGPAA
jgi:8-oxo-dGTP diphosphatase